MKHKLVDPTLHLKYHTFLDKAILYKHESNSTIYARIERKKGPCNYYEYLTYKKFDSPLLQIDPDNYDWIIGEDFIDEDNTLWRVAKPRNTKVSRRVPLNYPEIPKEWIKELQGAFPELTTRSHTFICGRHKILGPETGKNIAVTTEMLEDYSIFGIGERYLPDYIFVHSLVEDGKDEPLVGERVSEDKALIRWRGQCIAEDCSNEVSLITNAEEKWTVCTNEEGGRLSSLSENMNHLVCKECLEKESAGAINALIEQGLITDNKDGSYTLTEGLGDGVYEIDP